MQTRMKTQTTTEERKKPKASLIESHMSTRSQLQQMKGGAPATGPSGGAADTDEIMNDFMRIQETSITKTLSSELIDKGSTSQDAKQNKKVCQNLGSATIESAISNQKMKLVSRKVNQAKRKILSNKIAPQLVGNKRLRDDQQIEYDFNTSLNVPQVKNEESKMSKRMGGFQTNKRHKPALVSHLPQMQGIQKQQRLTKKQLEEFDKAQTQECLSDEGEEAEKCLYSLIFKAHQVQDSLIAKKQSASNIKVAKKKHQLQAQSLQASEAQKKAQQQLIQEQQRMIQEQNLKLTNTTKANALYNFKEDYAGGVRQPISDNRLPEVSQLPQLLIDQGAYELLGRLNQYNAGQGHGVDYNILHQQQQFINQNQLYQALMPGMSTGIDANLQQLLSQALEQQYQQQAQRNLLETLALYSQQGTENDIAQILSQIGISNSDILKTSPILELLLKSQLYEDQTMMNPNLLKQLYDGSYSTDPQIFGEPSKAKKGQQHVAIAYYIQYRQSLNPENYQSQNDNQDSPDFRKKDLQEQELQKLQESDQVFIQESPEKLINQAQLSQMSPEQQIAYFTESFNNSAASDKAKQQLKQMSMTSIHNITNTQISEIQSKLQMERESHQEILSSQRSSLSPEVVQQSINRADQRQ